MAITLVQKARNSAATGPSLAVTLPAATTAGNFLLAVLMSDNSASDTFTPPSGWSLARTQGNASDGHTLAVAYAANIAGGATTYTFNRSASGFAFTVLVAEYSGVATSSPLDQTNSATASSTTIGAGSVTTTNANELLVLAGVIAANATFTAGASMTLEDSVQNGGVTTGWEDRILAATGTFSPTITASGSATNNTGIQASFIAAGGGGSIVSGSATIQANAALVESAAQVVEPSGTIPTPANAALALSGARVVEPSGTVPVQANAALVESAQIVASPPIAMQANAALVASAQIRASATLQANAALVATGGLAGQGGGTIIANAALIETAARVQTNAAPQQANAALVVTGRVVTPSVTVAASSVLALTAAQVRAAPTGVQSNAALSLSNVLLLVSVALQANAVLVATGHIPPPPNYKSPTGTTALHATLTGSTTAGRLTGTTTARAGLTGSTVVRPLTGSTTPHTTLTGSTSKE